LVSFDIRHLPYIIYKNNEGGREELKRELENVAKEISPEVNYPGYLWPGYWWPDLNIKNLWPV